MKKLLDSARRVFGLGGTANDGDGNEINMGEFFGFYAEISYKKLAVDACVNLIAATLAGCEFLTFAEGREVRKDMYYLFNVRPNVNQSATEFWVRFISGLLKRNEALIVQLEDKRLYVADSFTVDEQVINPQTYEGVTIGSLTLNRRFYADEVLHVKLHDENIRRVVDGIYADYGKLIALAANNFKRNNALRIVVEEPGVMPMTELERAQRKKLYEEDFRKWFDADVPVALPLPQPLKLHDWSKNDRVQHASRDIKALVDDVFDFTAMAYRVPARLLRGDVAELQQAVDALVMFAIKPLAELIKDEINAKMYSKAEYLRRTYMKIDTRRIKHVDVARYAVAADRLFAAGVNSINDNRLMLDMEPIGEPWADKHVVTKNYTGAKALVEGGENSDDTQN